MGSYRTDREWSDRFVAEACRIVGRFVVEPAPHEYDVAQATDMITLRARNLMIGCRIRRPGYAERYPYDFTIRADRASGAKTELAKIVEGWGDLLLYGHADATETRIALWWLIDLAAFRAHLIRIPSKPGRDRDNGDGTRFKAFDLREFPPDPPILKGSLQPLPGKYAA